MGYNWRTKITCLLTCETFLTDPFHIVFFYLTEIRLYRATSVSQITSLNQYAPSMQTTFKEVKRDIIWCRSLFTQVCSSLTPPGLPQWNSAKKAVITGALKYTYSRIPTPSFLLGCHLHLEFPPSSDGNWMKIKQVYYTWLDCEVWLNLRTYREIADSQCSMFVQQFL